MAWWNPKTWGLRAESPLALPVPRLPSGRPQRNEDPARFGDIERAAAILQRCFDGNVHSYIDLCKSVRRYDGRLDAVCAKRVLAISGRRWAVKPPPGYENDREAIDNCRFVTKHLNATRGLATKLGHLGHAVLEGHAALQHVWYRNLDGEIATAPRELHPRLFGWDTITGQPGIYLDGIGGKLTPWGEAEIIWHNPVAGRADDPWLRGALRSRILASITKRMGVRWWLKLLERWGQPQVVAEKGSDEDGSESDDVLLAAMRAIGTDWRAVVPPGTKINQIPVTVQPELHEKWVQKCDADDAIAILGQNLSTEVVGGSFAAARAHAWVLATILEADLAELQETITDQWIEPLIRFNRPGSPVPWLYINPAPLSEITRDDMAIKGDDGRPAFTIAEFRASKGYDLQPDEAAVVASVPAGAIEAGPSKGDHAALPAPEPAPALPAPASSLPIEPGSIWTDSRDGHRIRVNAVEDGRVYAQDIDAPNAAGLFPQFSWSIATFRELCIPPE